MAGPSLDRKVRKLFPRNAMPDPPYRPPPGVSQADAELARLAADGQQRIHAEAERRADAQQKKAEHYLREALGEPETERAWLSSLPFAIDGYFEALSVEPDSECNLLVELRFSSARPPPDQNTMLGLLGLVDADASIEKVSALFQGRESGALVFGSGPISCGTNTRVNGEWVYSNRKIARYVHDLVDKVLLPLHRSHPLTRVSLTR